MKIRDKRLVFARRGLAWIFRKDWYSLYRWRNPDTYPMSSDTLRIVDIGAFSVGIRTLKDHKH